MKYTTRNILEINQENFNLTSEFNVDFKDIKKEYTKFLNKKFKNHSRVQFSKAVDFKKNIKIEKDDLCYKNSLNSRIKLYVSNEEIYNNNTVYKVNILDKRINKYYLIWFLNNPEIQNYLSLYCLGSVITYIPFKSFDNVEIPIPPQNKEFKVESTDVEIKIKSPYRKLLDIYCKEYFENYKKTNYMTAAILSGAICETLLHTYLLEKGLSEKSLKNKTLGGIIDLTEAFLLDRDKDVPLNHFREIQKLRNSAIHPALAKKLEPDNEINKTDFECFNYIIKCFGL